MAPNLRSTSRATSNNSPPTTPVTSVPSVDAPPFTDSTRPRKQRRTGTHSRLGVDTPQDGSASAVVLEDGPISRSTRSADQVTLSPSSETQNGHGYADMRTSASNVDETWIEPLPAPPQPSYRDTPWSAVSSDKNPVLASMKPLGQLPTSADLRKVGLQTGTRSLPRAAKANRVNGSAVNQILAAEITRPASAPAVGELKLDTSITDLASLPVPTSADYDVDKIKTVVENAIRLADSSSNHAVSRGLLRLWANSSNDHFLLSVLDSIVRQDPGPRQKAVFKTVMRDAFKSVKAEASPTSLPMSRDRSATSTASILSDKSADGVHNFAVEGQLAAPTGTTAAAAAAVSRSRKRGRNSEPLPATLVNDTTTSNLTLDEDTAAEESDGRLTKRARLRRTMPEIVPRDSRLRSSLSADAREPGPTRPRGRAKARQAALSRENAPDNSDQCRQCGSGGNLLCCDGCPNSFHFSCLSPPLDPAHPPEEQWFCPSCSARRTFHAIKDKVDNLPQREWMPPAAIRDHFAGVRASLDGKYEELATNVRSGLRGRGNRTGRADEQYLTRLFDAKGKLIVCVACGLTSNGVRPIIQCDYCPCSWHLDCVDPPLAIPPNQKSGSLKSHHSWMCPNHIEHELFTINLVEGKFASKSRIRRPRHPRVMDVDVLPEDSEPEAFEEEEIGGIVYRVSEHGLKLDFIDRVKRENFQDDMLAAAAAQYNNYAKQKIDALMAKAEAFYLTPEVAHRATPPFPEQINTSAEEDILASRSAADREAIANLIAFANGNDDTHPVQGLEQPNQKIDLLVDQLLANAPAETPHASSELESLRALQALIGQRIDTLVSSSL